MSNNLIGLYKENTWTMTSDSLTENEEHDNPTQILKNILGCMSQLFLDSNMCNPW